jgi:VanZ family protein
VQIIVMSVTIVTLAVFIGLLRDAASTFSGYRHVIVMASVTEETPDLSGLLVGVTVMTLMTLIYGLILDRGCISTS